MVHVVFLLHEMCVDSIFVYDLNRYPLFFYMNCFPFFVVYSFVMDEGNNTSYQCYELTILLVFYLYMCMCVVVQ